MYHVHCVSGKINEYHYLFTCEFFQNSCVKIHPQMSNESPDCMKRDFVGEENLGNMARFAKIIMKVFTFKRNLDIQPPSKKSTIVTLSGRQVKPLTKLNLWFDIQCKDATVLSSSMPLTSLWICLLQPTYCCESLSVICLLFIQLCIVL